MKRLFDITISAIGLLVFSPIMIPVLFLTWIQDRHSPFYIADRVGKNFSLFKMIKVRSMVVNADKSGVASTSGNDSRITRVGYFVRKYKLDEISQLWNVLIGDMSIVGPRPNVKVEVDLYTTAERNILSIKPGITDFASIVFSDEGEILRDSLDPDLDYNKLIRPWKSRLGLLYINHQSLLLDIRLIFLTVKAIINKPGALRSVNRILNDLDADELLIKVSKRDSKLVPYPPPGSNEVVSKR